VTLGGGEGWGWVAAARARAGAGWEETAAAAVKRQVRNFGHSTCLVRGIPHHTCVHALHIPYRRRGCIHIQAGSRALAQPLIAVVEAEKVCRRRGDRDNKRMMQVAAETNTACGGSYCSARPARRSLKPHSTQPALSHR